jgi:hypothetical protein
MAEQEGRQLVPIDQARELAVDTLTKHFARDDIEVEDLESRLDAVYAARTLAQLQAVTADLPALSPGAAVDVLQPAATAMISAAEVPARTYQIAILSGSERKGAWVPGRRHYTYALMGGAGLDFREARFGPGVTEVTVMVAMGGVEIIVPPDLTVHTSGFAFMGGIDTVDQAPMESDPTAPVLKINAYALMGGVEVQVRLPGESTKEARRRRKVERKQRRLARRAEE